MKNIYLTGLRASGKTTVGKALAERMDRAFVDTDHLLVDKYGVQISDMVEKEGWDIFRKRESDILREVAARQECVVACGGGIVLKDENRALLSRGFTVYLNVAIEELSSRLSKDPNESQRPSLTGRSIEDEVREVFERRDPMYRECAHMVLGADSVGSVVEEIVTAYGERAEKS